MGRLQVNAIFTPLNEILSVALSGISGRIRLRENVALLMRWRLVMIVEAAGSIEDSLKLLLFLQFCKDRLFICSFFSQKASLAPVC